VLTGIDEGWQAACIRCV